MGSKRKRPGMPLRQRGAVAIWVAVSLVALFTATFLAIDVGRLYYTQRDLQRLASLAATAGTQVASGCAGQGATGKPGTLAAVTTLVRSAMQSNGGSEAVGYLTGVNGFPPIELGMFVPVNNLRTFKPLAAGDNRINAVRVNLSRPQPTPFIGFLTGGGTLKASASAEQPLAGSFSVGSTLLHVDLGDLNNLLGPLLCPPNDQGCQKKILDLNVASYSTGLANVSVSIDQLATAAGVSVQDLADPVTLAATTVPLPQLLNGLGATLNVDASISSLLGNLAAATAGTVQQIPLGNLLGSVDPASGATPAINLLDLLGDLGDATHAAPDGSVVPIRLPYASVNLPGVATVGTYLKILQPAEASLPNGETVGQLSGAGRPGVATARTSQVSLQLRVQVLPSVTTSLNLLLKAVGLQLLPLNLGIDVGVSSAVAHLDSLSCPSIDVNGGMPIATLSASPSLADVQVGTFTGTPTATSVPVLNEEGTVPVVMDASGKPLLSVQFTVAAVGASPEPIPLANPVVQFVRQENQKAGTPPIYDALGGPGVMPVIEVPDENPQTVGEAEQINVSLNALPVASVNPIVNSLLNTVNTLLIVPLLAGVNDLAESVINPVLKSLGIQTGAATVTMNAALVGRPIKVATCQPGSPGANACLIAP